MRYVIEVMPAGGDRVEGSVRPEGRDRPTPFCGWLELLRLLEPEPEPATTSQVGARRDDGPSAETAS